MHIRTHSHYSIKRAFGTPKEIISKVKELGHKFYGITEYGCEHSFPYYWQLAKKEGIDLLYGVELFITEDMKRKGRPDFSNINFGNDTIILMAKNYDGYTELLKTVSIANEKENHFMVPRIDWEFLSEMNLENLVCILPYDFSTITKLILSNEDRQAKQLIKMLKSLFGADLYFEISANVSNINKLINNNLLKFAKDNDIKCFASCNIHYPNKEDKKVHDVVLAMGEKKTFAQNDLYSLSSNDNYIRDVDSVRLGLHQNDLNDEIIEELINNIEEIYVKCNFLLEFAPMSLPNIDIILPEEYKGKPVEYFIKEIEKGWNDLIIPRIESGEWDEIKTEDIPTYIARKEYEFAMIKDIFTMKDQNHPMKEGFIDYFLVVADYIKWAKGIDRRIMKDAPIVEVGPARGSVSGSLVGYLTKMSTVDPIPFGLTFERFINPERVSWPDIDMDFDPENAWLVEKYLIATYGHEHVAHILTFQTAAGKKAFESVSKILSGKYGKYKKDIKEDLLKSQNELAKLLQLDAKTAKDIQETIDSSRKIKDQLNPDAVDADGNSLYNKRLHEIAQLSAYKELFEIMVRIEGVITSTGSHPGAVVITGEPLWKYTARTQNGKYPDNSVMLTTSYEKYALEEVNTMKFDILRLNELIIVRETLKFIKESIGVDIDINKINPYDIQSNLKILELMKNGDLDGVFQFSSHLYKSIINEVLSEIKDRTDEELAKELFDIIVALEALGRPGPLEGGMIPTFASGLANPNTIKKIHPIVDNILKETYGNMLYQEQILFILQQLGGFSLGQADMVRRGIASGKREKIEEQRIPFIDGVKKIQLEKNPSTTEEEMEKLLKLGDEIFTLMAFWSGYGFNKAHSVGYGFLSLRGAYLKANYKPYFMAALMSANSSNEEKVTRYIDEIRSRGINVLPPKINKSLRGFTVVNDEILFGLEAIKGVGPGAIDKILLNGPYENFMDFVIKSGTDARALEPLIKAGYFNEDKKFLLKYWRVFKEIKDGKTKAEESLIDFILESGITEVTQESIENRLNQIISDKVSKKRTEKTRQETLDLIDNIEYSNSELLNMEKEVIGIFLSESPLDKFKDIILNATKVMSDIKDSKVNDEFFVVGLVVETPKTRYDKNGNAMCFLKFQLFDNMIEIPVFAESYEKYSNLLIEGNVLISKAKKIRGGGLTLNKLANLDKKEEQFRKFFNLEAI